MLHAGLDLSAQKVKGLAPLACKTDRIDSRVLAVLSHRDLVPAIWLPDPRSAPSASSRGSACTWSSEATSVPRSPEKLVGYTGLCPRVVESGESDRRGPLSKHGPTYLRWALVEATMHALKHPAYSEGYQRTKRRLGRQRRGARSPRSTSPAGSPTRSGTC
jgi:hypothetical protein